MGIPSRARRPVSYATPSLPIPGLLTFSPAPLSFDPLLEIPRRRCSKHHRPGPSWGIRDTSGGFPSQTASAGSVPEVDKAAAYAEEEVYEREWLPVPDDDDLASRDLPASSSAAKPSSSALHRTHLRLIFLLVFKAMAASRSE